MRPLVVLLLVVVAAIGLILTLQNSDPNPTPTLEGPGPATATEDPKPAPQDPVQAPENVDRVATDTDAAGSGVVADALVDSPGENSLYGLVTNDANQPLAGAKVELSRDPLLGQEVVMAWIENKRTNLAPVSTTTDAKGQYRFTNIVPRRDYYLIASHADYAPVQDQMVAVGDHGDFQGPNIVLRAGSAIEGTVTDVAGNLVPDAELWLDSAFYAWDAPSPDRLTVRSDATGRFEFKNVYAVTKQLTCNAEGYGGVTRTPINVTGQPGERITVDFKLALGQPLAGRVVGPDGAGIAGAKIMAHSAGNNQSYRGETVSLDDGSFQMLSLNPGNYAIDCQAPGFRQAKFTRVAAGNMNVIIDMVAQACVSGRVVDASSGNAAAAFQLEVRRLPPNQPIGIGVATESAGLEGAFVDVVDGNFQLCGLDPGTYALLATSNNSAPTYSESFTIVPNQTSANVIVRLSRGGSIKGRVVGPGGTPIAGAVVYTMDDTMDDAAGMGLFGDFAPSSATPRRVVTNAQGAFELRFLTPEKYQVRVEHKNFAQGKLRGLMVSEGQANDVGAVTMLVGGTVKGTVFGPGGGPLARGFVHLESSLGDLVYDTRTDGEGRYSFQHVRPGDYTLSASGQPTASDNAFEVMTEMRSSRLDITVTEGAETLRDLSPSGG